MESESVDMDLELGDDVEGARNSLKSLEVEDESTRMVLNLMEEEEEKKRGEENRKKASLTDKIKSTWEVVKGLVRNNKLVKGGRQNEVNVVGKRQGGEGVKKVDKNDLQN